MSVKFVIAYLGICLAIFCVLFAYLRIQELREERVELQQQTDVVLCEELQALGSQVDCDRLPGNREFRH